MPYGVEPADPMTVLHVEDDPALAALVRKALTRRGHAVVHVATGEEAIARLGAGGIDVVALDHSLSAETGLDILARVGPRDRRPPIVYVTGSGDARLAVEALKSGADDYVIKDVSGEFYDLLIAALEQALERWRLKKARAENERLVREARDRAELLLREVNHRVANSLGLVAAMVRMQASLLDDDEAKRALQETQNRISAVAGVHRHLYSSAGVGEVDVGDYLGRLLDELQTSLAGAGAAHRIVADLAPLVLKTDLAVSLGIVVGELVTNAFKYAYPDGTPGDIRVRVAVDADEVAVSVEDDGVGWSGEGPIKGSGLGSKIVGAMCRTLGATLQWRNGPEDGSGTRAVVRFARTAPEVSRTG